MAITVGTTTEIDASGSADLDICMLTDTLAMVLYEDTGGTFKARTISISGTTLTPNAEVTVNTDTDGGVECKLVRLTATSAMAIYLHSGFSWHAGARILTVSGTTITVNSETVLTNRADTGRFSAAFLSSTQVLYVYGDLADAGFSGNGRILSVSGTTITENAETEIVSTQFSSPDVTYLSSTKGVVAWIDTSSGTGTEDIKAAVLSVSGTTISVGSAATVDSGLGSATEQDEVRIMPLSSSAVVIAFIDASDSSMRLRVLSVSGTTITVNAVTIVSTTAYDALDGDALNSTNFVVHVDTGPNFRILQFSISGTTITLEDEVTTEASINQNSAIAALSSTSAIAAFQGSVDGYVITFTGTGIESDEFTAAPMISKPCDIDADGNNGGFIYIGALASDGTPVLIKFSTALNADGSVVFEPRSGSDIGVETGRFDADIIWVAGDFDSTNVVEKSEDGGTSFSVKDPGTFGAIGAFKAGPDSDDRVLAFDSDNGDLRETIDSGDNWTAINTSVTPVVKAIGRLGQNVQEAVFGNESAASDNIDYSINSGVDLEDYSGGFPEVDVNGVIIN